MQIMKMPMEIHKNLVRICRHEFGGRTIQKEKIHLINWSSICQQKEKGGLNIRKSQDINKSLLAKLHWRLLTEEDSIYGFSL